MVKLYFFYYKIFLGNHGHLVSNFLINFFNQFFRTIENYTTKMPRFKTPKKNMFSNTFNSSYNTIQNNNNSNYMQLADTKIETIYSKLKENNHEIIRNSFFLAEDEISMAKFDSQFSGSTTVMIFIIGNKLLCANAGDSRAIMITESLKKNSGKNFSNFKF